MTWMLNKLAPSPHLLDPAETRKAACRYMEWASLDLLEKLIQNQMRAIEHEQAILQGFIDQLE